MSLTNGWQNIKYQMLVWSSPMYYFSKIHPSAPPQTSITFYNCRETKNKIKLSKIFVENWRQQQNTLLYNYFLTNIINPGLNQAKPSRAELVQRASNSNRSVSFKKARESPLHVLKTFQISRPFSTTSPSRPCPSPLFPPSHETETEAEIEISSRTRFASSTPRMVCDGSIVEFVGLPLGACAGSHWPLLPLLRNRRRASFGTENFACSRLGLFFFIIIIIII